MDFTREPIIETVVTPKEGCKLVVRSSKGTGQEEYFVDALEVVAFGNAIFYRSLERPKSFLVPASDYEVLEVREARMVLKNVGLDRSIKIGGGRDASKAPKEIVQEKISISEEEVAVAGEDNSENKENRKRDRRRQSRRKRGTSASEGEESTNQSDSQSEILAEAGNVSPEPPTQTGSTLASILPPPPMLISETIGRYKDNILFKGAFYTKEDQQQPIEPITDVPPVPLMQPEYGSFEMSIEDEEGVYQQRTQQQPSNDFLQEQDDLIPSSHREEETFPEKDYSIPKEQDPS